MDDTPREFYRQKMLDYVASFGLDAHEISDESDEEGFYLNRPGANREVKHPWPEGFDYKWLRTLQDVWRRM